MKKVIMFIFIIGIGILSFGSIESMAEKVPSNSQTVIIVEDFEQNYGSLKSTVLLDTLMNQLAIEQVIKQYIEVISYNSGLDPESVYQIFKNDIGMAFWYEPASENPYFILIAGPMEDPRNAKSSLEKVLPALLPQASNLKIAVDNSYLYMGSIDKYSTTEKGFDSEVLKGDMEKGFGYAYSSSADYTFRTSAMISEKTLKIKGYTEAKTDAAKESLRQTISDKGIADLEKLPHYSFLSVMLRLNDISELQRFVEEQLEGDQINISDLNTGDLDLSKINLDRETLLKLKDYLTGELVVDIDVPIEQLFSALTSLQGAGQENAGSIVNFVTRLGFNGSLDEVKIISPTEFENQIDESLKTSTGQFLWKQSNYLYLSSGSPKDTEEKLAVSASSLDSKSFENIRNMLPENRFAMVFINTGSLLSDLLQMEIESGVAFAAGYSTISDRVDGILIVK